jgi:rare lipoprotein A (peptidoglycan hydrolase)
LAFAYTRRRLGGKGRREMAWQRLLCIGICAVGLASAAHAALETTNGIPVRAANPGPAPTKKQASKATARKIHRHANAKTAAREGKTSASKSAKLSRSVHVGDREAGQVGFASWYGGERHGKAMAGGGRFDWSELTAAHRTLPLQSNARVTNMANGRSVTVRITDRGPTGKGRIIDVSQSAAEQLGMRHSGLARVQVEPVTPAIE